MRQFSLSPLRDIQRKVVVITVVVVVDIQYNNNIFHSALLITVLRQQ